MKLFIGCVNAVSRILYWISCGAIAAIMFLTVVDVVLRRSGHPIDFAYEVVVFLAAIVIGFALPESTVQKAHVTMEFITVKVSPRWRKILSVGTRWLGLLTFAVIGWNIILYAGRLRQSGQCSAILQIPEYPVAYAVALACLVECLVLFSQLFETEERPS